MSHNTWNQSRNSGISLFCRDESTEKLWKAELRTLLRGFMGGNAYRVMPLEQELHPLIVVDAARAGWAEWAAQVDRSGKSLILAIEEGDLYPSGEALHLVDDVIVFPFRGAELMSVLRHHRQRLDAALLEREALKAIRDLESANAVIERILSAKTPRRYSGLKGIQIMSKHLSGLKPGGDYFDVFESDKKDFVHFLMVDSSNYGISAAVLGMILSSSAKIANETSCSSFHWVRAIHEELRLTMGEKGHFSIFFGRLNRRDFTLHYQLHGSIEGYVVDKEGVCRKFGKQGPPLSAQAGPGDAVERIVQLSPKDRVVLLSDGFVNGAGGEAQLARIFTGKIDQDPFSLVNELVFRIKSQLSSGETFPGEDCSAIVIDVENRVLRLAPTG
jgi:hypothetical protein